MKHMLYGLHTVHANLTAVNGTGFLILYCFVVITIFEIEKFFRGFVFSSKGSLYFLVFYM